MPAAVAAAEAAQEAPGLVLEFALDPAVAARLTRHPAIVAMRAGRGRSAAEELIWLDTLEGALAAEGLALEAPRRGERRRLRVLPPKGAAWLPGTPPETTPGVEDTGSDAPLVPLAAFSGRHSVIPLSSEPGPLRLELCTGKLRAVADERPAARLRIGGAAGPVLSLARRLASDLPLLPPAAALAEEGRALARGEIPRPRRRGPPDLGDAGTVEAALVAAIGHLLEVMLHYAPLCRPEAGPEGVHQMRVALRRLRSVLKAFRPAARCAAVDAFDRGLQILAKRLGEARDLDVFQDGIGARVATAMPGDRRIASLCKAMEARRLSAYRALREALEGPGFRLLILDGMELALRRPWQEAASEAPEQATVLAERLDAFAFRLLDKRWHRLCSEGEEIEALSAEALHELRLSAKRLRYAAELFAPLWPGKAARRFLKRLSALQDALGIANDTAVARGLVARIGPPVPPWAIGAVEGFAVAEASGARKRALSAWKDLMVVEPFWSDV